MNSSVLSMHIICVMKQLDYLSTVLYVCLLKLFYIDKHDYYDLHIGTVSSTILLAIHLKSHEIRCKLLLQLG